MGSTEPYISGWAEHKKGQLEFEVRGTLAAARAQGSSDHCDESQASSASNDVNKAWSSLFCSVMLSPCLHFSGLGPPWISQCFHLYPGLLSLSLVKFCLLLPPSVLLAQIPSSGLSYALHSCRASGCLCEH